MPLFSDPAAGVVDPYLRRAFELAERCRGRVSPNPLVGCVIVRDGAVVGEGYHEGPGTPHAEAAALAQAGDRARGAHVYVTLEPCNHTGRTPPCAPALVRAGVAAVTIGMRDPNPEVAGGGAEVLASGGVRVEWADASAPFERQNEAWLTRLATGRPFVRVKVAVTLDGRPALRASRRARISGSGGRSVTMRLRAEATAVAVGAATLAVDDPSLTVRDDADVPVARQPRRVVLARTTVPDRRATLFHDAYGAPLVICADTASRPAVDELERAGVPVVTYRYSEGVAGTLSAIARAGIDDVLIEAGPTLLTSLWRADVIDELVVVTAGGMAGTAAPPLYLGAPDAAGDVLTPPTHAVEAGVVDRDAVTVWRPVRSMNE